MEYILLAIPAVILGLAWWFRGQRDFSAPAVTPISDATLSAFEAVPSLWVNPAEAACFVALRETLPRGYHIHGKTRLEDIIRVRRDVRDEARWKLRGRVKSRHVDYLITDRNGRPVLAIELDGAAHDKREQVTSDDVKTALFDAVGLPLRRIRVGEDFKHIAATLWSDIRSS